MLNNMENRYTIPADFLPGFTAILELEDTSWQRIVQCIPQIEEGAGPKTIENQLRQSVDNLGDTILPLTIFSLGSLLKDNRGKEEQIAEDLVEAYKQADTHIDADAEQKLLNRLSDLLKSLHAVAVTYKALQLMEEAQQVFAYGRIITDIRLVFNDEVADQKRHALVVHNCRIETREGRQKKDLFFSCTKNDLLDIRNQIERALQKEETLRKDYGDAMPFIDVKE